MTPRGDVLGRACLLLSQRYGVSYGVSSGHDEPATAGRPHWVAISPLQEAEGSPGFDGRGASAWQAQLSALVAIRNHFVDVRLSTRFGSADRHAASVLIEATDALLSELEQQGE